MYLNLITNPDLSQSYTTSSDPSSFHGWTLSSMDTIPTIYQFSLNIESSDIEVVGDFKLYQNYQKYPSYNFGNMKYKKGKLSTIPYSSQIGTGEYIIDIELLNSLISFLNDKSKKILTNPANESMTVCTFGVNYKYLENITSYPFSVSFEYIQISN